LKLKAKTDFAGPPCCWFWFQKQNDLNTTCIFIAVANYPKFLKPTVFPITRAYPEMTLVSDPTL